jgi:hypothetical protein
MMMVTVRKLMLGVSIVLVAAGCAAPQPTRPQATPAAAAVVPTATRAQRARPTPTPEAKATATALPTVAPSATATTAPTAAPSLTPTVAPTRAAAAPANLPAAPGSSVSSGVLLSLDPRKYPVPALLTPGNNATYHVSQPVVHLAWSATPTDLMTFGQTPGCVSDATNFRRAFESYQLVIHSLDAQRADQVQWTNNGTVFDLNLTTVPQGRYAWSVSVVTLCESYVVGQRNDTRPLYDNKNNDPAYHKSTLQTTYLGPVSPTSETRIINWIP